MMPNLTVERMAADVVTLQSRERLAAAIAHLTRSKSTP
jgi:hypothetical protein